AVYLAAKDKLTTEVGRKVIVLITDGVDQGSRLDIKQAIEAAQKADAVIYSIYYYDAGAYGGHGMISFGGGGEGYLKRMSDDTGGHVVKVDRKHTLNDVSESCRTRCAANMQSAIRRSTIKRTAHSAKSNCASPIRI